MQNVGVCAAVIPCLNEAVTISDLVLELRSLVPLVVVVDDGSTDSSAGLAREAGAAVICHRANLGKGAALRTGLEFARKSGCSWSFTLDGDGQHAAQDTISLSCCARQSRASLIVGNRMHDSTSIPWLRRLVNHWMSRQLSRLAGKHLPDTQCGYRLLNLSAWSSLTLTTDHFEVESEMIFAFLVAGHDVAFAPVRVISRGRASHIRPLKDSLRWWKWRRSFLAGSKLHSRRPAAGRMVGSAEMMLVR